MRISESYMSYYPRLLAVAPATARQILRANTESLATELVTAASMSGGAEREALVSELRSAYEQGRYQVDEAQVSICLIDAHLKA